MNKAVQTNTPDKKIEKSATDANLWLEVTTLNVLPGEEVLIELEDEDTEKEIQKGEKKLASATCIDPSGKGILLLNSKKEITSNNIAANEEVLDNNETNEASGILKEGKWTIDLEGTKPITRAVPGMLVYFHIKTSIPNGESVHIELYEDDNNEKEEKGKGDKDEHQPLVSSATKKPATHETVSNGKIIKTIQLDNLEKLIKNDVDKQIELYFRCSYNGTNVELPSKPKDYLVVGTLVVDRYKMPGLNGSGLDIADDLSYGTGVPQKKEIYTKIEVEQFIKEYKNSGLNEDKHALFTNKKDFPAIAPTVSKQVNYDANNNNNNNRFSLIMEETNPIKYVVPSEIATPNGNDEKKAKELTQNQKAKYSKKEIEALGTLMDFTADVSESSLWTDFKIMQECMVWGELNTVLDQMIAKFKSNTGGIFENSALTNSVKKNPSTQRYCMYVENYIAEKIKQEGFSNIIGVEDKEPDFEDERTERVTKDKIKGNDIRDSEKKLIDFTRPSFTYKNNNNLLEGRTLALNDIWATQVILKELKNEGESYTCKYEVILWDNFGLDKPDMQKFFSYGAGFRAWFVLQHLYGYKPFVTKIAFNKEFKGIINEGREERRAKQKSKEITRQKKIEDIKFKTRRRGWEY